ncbi:hypothetical protein SSTU70S_07081 [Stutzerimonas stutzeri]
MIFRDLLRQLALHHPTRLQVIHWLDSVQGRPLPEQLAAFAEGFAQAEAFICGPGPFMDGAVAALKAAGLPSQAVHVERFVSLPGEGEQSTESVVEHAGALAARLTVELDGERHSLDCQPGELLLAAMRREGLQPPHSCSGRRLRVVHVHAGGGRGGTPGQARRWDADELKRGPGRWPARPSH